MFYIILDTIIHIPQAGHVATGISSSREELLAEGSFALNSIWLLVILSTE